MKLFLTFALACLPLFCFGAPSVSYTSYFNNVHVYTNITLGGVTRNTWPSSSGVSGTVINTGASTVGAVPSYTDTTGTNVAPSTTFSLGTSTNATLTGTLLANGTTSTNAVWAYGVGTNGTFVGHPTQSAVFWGSDFTGLSLIDVISDATASSTEGYLGVYSSGAPTTRSYLQLYSSVDNSEFHARRQVTGTTTGRVALGVDSSGPYLNFGGSSSDVFIRRDAANTLAMRNGTSAQVFRVYNTYTDASNYERAKIAWGGNELRIGSEALGTGTKRPVGIEGAEVTIRPLSGSTSAAWLFNTSGHMLASTDNTYDIGASGATRPRNLYVAGSGTFGSQIVGGASAQIGASGYFFWNGRAGIASPSDGVIRIANNADNDFNRLQFGGTSASFPALKRSTTNIVVRLADDSANTGLEANVLISRLNATSAAAPTIASATTIAPTNSIVFISGTDAIETITAPAPISATGGQITLIPTGLFTTTTAGNIALASTAVVSKALIMTYDSGTTKWYPSY